MNLCFKNHYHGFQSLFNTSPTLSPPPTFSQKATPLHKFLDSPGFFTLHQVESIFFPRVKFYEFTNFELYLQIFELFSI